MEYLKAAITLLKIIKDTNAFLLDKIDSSFEEFNQMRIKLNDQNTQNIVMDAFSNDFVSATLKDTQNSEAFVITDLATMNAKETELTYLLYKGYHNALEKGIVFYQVIDKTTHKPIGELQFSNTEDNIFYSYKVPDMEESSCNAMETDKKITNGKSIVFFIGNMNEERLLYDIQRLIFDTANNVSKHEKLKFHFIIQISRYGGSPSNKLKEQVKAIDAYTQKHVLSEYPNAKFAFEFEEDTSLN